MVVVAAMLVTCDATRGNAWVGVGGAQGAFV